METDTKNRTELKSYFVTNSIPTEGSFSNLIDAMLNQKDDGVVKLPGNPLCIEASGDDAGPKDAVHFYRDFADPEPDWTLNLNPLSNPDDPKSTRLGFSISDGKGNSRLFIDRSTGNIGIGVAAPTAQLSLGEWNAGSAGASISG